jgi:hypothetical protein
VAVETGQTGLLRPELARGRRNIAASVAEMEIETSPHQDWLSVANHLLCGAIIARRGEHIANQMRSKAAGPLI